MGSVSDDGSRGWGAAAVAVVNLVRKAGAHARAMNTDPIEEAIVREHGREGFGRTRLLRPRDD